MELLDELIVKCEVMKDMNQAIEMFCQHKKAQYDSENILKVEKMVYKYWKYTVMCRFTADRVTAKIPLESNRKMC